MSSKNNHIGPKSWKSNQEEYKLANSLLIENYTKFPPANLVKVACPKNLKQNLSKKHTKYQRHYSQEDFKKFHLYNHYHINSGFEQPNTNINIRAQEQYFGESMQTMNKNSKHVHSIQKLDKNIAKMQAKDKKCYQFLNVNPKANILKQTSSTQSADNLGVNKHTHIPSFVRCKNTKNSNNNYNSCNKINYDYFSSFSKTQTPRHLQTLRRENFKIISKLGEGKFGKVFLVKEIYTGFVLAMKIVQKKKIVRQNLLQQFIKQLKIQSYLNHPNIISFYGFFSDDTHFYTLMQLGCDGQLYSLISNSKLLTQQATSFIVKNLLEAIQYIHENKVLHRDIKPQNIVITMGNVKICDFGWAVNKMFPGDLRSTFCGTPLYLSPQIIQGSLYNEKVDLWAIGILAYELYFGCTPFDINDQGDLYKIVKSSIRFPANRQITPEFKQFMNAMLQKNPNDRLTSKKLLQMSFITKYRDFETCEQLCR